MLLDERESERWEKVKLVDFPSVPSTAFGKERRKLIEFLKTLFLLVDLVPLTITKLCPKKWLFWGFTLSLLSPPKNMLFIQSRAESRQTFSFLDQRKREKINFHPFGFGRNQQSLFRKQLPRSFLEHQYWWANRHHPFCVTQANDCLMKQSPLITIMSIKSFCSAIWVENFNCFLFLQRWSFRPITGDDLTVTSTEGIRLFYGKIINPFWQDGRKRKLAVKFMEFQKFKQHVQVNAEYMKAKYQQSL